MKRITWIDVLKFLGIGSIYFWHLGESIGNSYSVILLYHVPLFFFVSGCMESLQSETSFGTYLKKKARAVLVPFFIFAFLSMAVVICYEGFQFPLVKLMLKQIAYGGIRNRIFAYSLWFLTCLFVVSVLFQIIKKLKSRVFIFTAGIVLYIIAARYMPYKPNMVPIIPYNADCALYYMVYYCTGYCVFPCLKNFFEQKGKRRDRCLIVTGVLSGGYAIALFCGKDFLFFLEKIPVVRIFYPFMAAVVLIWLNIEAAYLLRNNAYMQKLGRETLYLCGNEFIIKTLAVSVLSLMGISVENGGALFGIVYVFILLGAVHFIVVPLQKRMRLMK